MWLLSRLKGALIRVSSLLTSRRRDCPFWKFGNHEIIHLPSNLLEPNATVINLNGSTVPQGELVSIGLQVSLSNSGTRVIPHRDEAAVIGNQRVKLTVVECWIVFLLSEFRNLELKSENEESKVIVSVNEYDKYGNRNDLLSIREECELP
ncbi:hypothetical protein CEXT_770201 [Caerostris extrusa]|uniref:Uncharacterized protein n=1 Tax=Caerostris extrusa TaxID=172846 RepID=A0AAV4NLL7_CAEEX|nr:hypothetical protein CEXT_770201 [Caerostris extrusa]